MPPRPAFAVVLLLLLSLLCCHQAADRDKVIWMETEMPPYFIQSGPLKDQGYGDVISDILQKRLTNYDHEVVVTNITRHFYKFKQGEKVCSVGLFRTPEREQFIAFSIPSFLTLPVVLIINKERWQDFGRRNTVKLGEILDINHVTIGLAKDRSYGQAVDQILDRHAGQHSLVKVAGQELSLNLFKMLMLNRLDGIIGLPEEALYQAGQLGLRDRIMTLAIEENQHGRDDWLSAVGCSNNEWGRAVVAEINRVLLAERPTDQYRAAYERWLDDNSLETFRKVYTDIFLPSGR